MDVKEPAGPPMQMGLHNVRLYHIPVLGSSLIVENSPAATLRVRSRDWALFRRLRVTGFVGLFEQALGVAPPIPADSR
jgi:hypothetical protein